jgi:hypothetical protein
MADYRVDMIEVRHVRVSYYVEADTPAQAKEKAEAGETTSEKERDAEVVSRHPDLFSEPKRL